MNDFSNLPVPTMHKNETRLRFMFELVSIFRGRSNSEFSLYTLKVGKFMPRDNYLFFWSYANVKFTRVDYSSRRIRNIIYRSFVNAINQYADNIKVILV